MRNTTIVDIAKMASVSVSTVSRVINNHHDVSGKTREKVLAVIAEHEFVPNNNARSLKQESMRAVAVVMKGFSNLFFNGMIPVIQKILEENKYTMLLHQLDTNEDEVNAAISICKEKKPRGIIFMGGNFTHSRKKLLSISAPFVMLTMTLDESVDRESFSSVTIDDFKVGQQVADRICNAGHRKIAVIASNRDDISVSSLRLNGFLDGLRRNGLETEESRIAYAREFTHNAGYKCAKQLLEKTDFTCLFCVSDIMALGAMRAMHEQGVRIPQDISVIGFDGLNEGRYSIPSLASVQQPGQDMAKKSVNILLNHLRTGAKNRHCLFDATFLEGESFVSLVKR